FGQPDLPPTLAVVYFQKDGSLARRVVGWRFDENEVAAHVGNANGSTIDQKPHLDFGRVCAVILAGDHERKPAAECSCLCHRPSPPDRRAPRLRERRHRFGWQRHPVTGAGCNQGASFRTFLPPGKNRLSAARRRSESTPSWDSTSPNSLDATTSCGSAREQFV